MHKLRLLHRQDEGGGGEDINNSVIKSKKRKIKISDIYTCDKRRRVREGGGGKWLLRSEEETKQTCLIPLRGGGLHFFMAADSSECVAPAEINTMLLLFTAKETGGRGRE